ncbi:MAG: hypothetical protein AAGD96_36530, partial [Chloroflexota bacterium]
MSETIKKRSFWRVLFDNRSLFGTVIFWIYNVIFIAFVALGFAPIVLPSVIQGAREGFIPGFYIAYGVILVSIPFIAAVVGFFLTRRSESQKLFLLGYGIQGPLMLILAVRFFGIGQTTIPVKIVMIVATIG